MDKIDLIKAEIERLRELRISCTSKSNIEDLRDCGEYCDALDNVLAFICSISDNK